MSTIGSAERLAELLSIQGFHSNVRESCLTPRGFSQAVSNWARELGQAPGSSLRMDVLVALGTDLGDAIQELLNLRLLKNVDGDNAPNGSAPVALRRGVTFLAVAEATLTRAAVRRLA